MEDVGGATNIDGGDLPVMGLAGEHQVDGARTALGHAYGGGAQYFAMWIIGADKPP